MSDAVTRPGSAPLVGAALDLLRGILTAAPLGPGAAAISERPYIRSVFLEPGSLGHRYSGNLVLAPSLDPAHPEFEARLRGLLDSGAAGVVVKRPETELPELSPEFAGLLLLDRDADWADTAQSLRALGSEDSNLVASGIRQGDLFSLANTLASLAGGAVSLVDTAGRVIGYSTHADQPIDSLRRSTTLALHEGHHPRTDDEFQELATSARALFFAGGGSLYGRVALPVRAAGELLGTVWIIQVDPSGADKTQRFLDSVEPLVSHHMLRARETAQVDERRSTDLVRALFEDAESRRTAAAQLDLEPGAAHTVVCFRLLEARGANPVLGAQQLLHQAATTAKGQFAWSHCAVLDGVVVALLGNADTSLVRLFADRITRISGGGAIAGIGRVADTQALIPRSYRDASGVSRLLVTQLRPPNGSSGRTVAEFSEVRAELGLSRLGEMLQDSDLLEGDGAERILAHDQEHQSRLADTLLAVLTHQGSVRLASQDLHIHQNTVRYRLETIRTELGIDLDHPPTRLWIWLRLSSSAGG